MMDDLELSFDQRPWEIWLESGQAGKCVSAVQLLTLLEEETDEEAETALQAVQDMGLTLDIGQLPVGFGSGETAARLRLEAELAAKGLKPEMLEAGDPLRLYLEEVAATPAAGDEALLANQAAEGSESAMERLTNLGLSRVIALAAEYTGRGVLLLDLIQEGSMGLWQGICEYSGGDYAVFRDSRIRFAMEKAIVIQARSSGIGQKMRMAMEDYRAVDERLLSELGRTPTLEEIAEGMHISEEEAGSVSRMVENARLMNRIRPEEQEQDTPEEQEQAVEDTARFQMRQRIDELLSRLDPVDARLLTLRFGLEDGKSADTARIAQQLGISAEEVTRREAAALAKLRN